jgi:hypothetical protein
MTRVYQTNPQLKLGVRAYAPFSGLATLRPDANADVGENQSFSSLNNAYVDSVGQVTLERGAELIKTTSPVQHVNFYSPTGVAAAVLAEDNTIALVSDNDISLSQAFSRFAPVASTAFSRKLVFFQRGLAPIQFDGSIFSLALASSIQYLTPAFGTTVQRRLCVAGIPSLPTVVLISRVDNGNVFAAEEAAGEASVLRAGYIDVGNLLASVDEITGLSPIEQNRLVIFTRDRAFVFKLDPDISQWAIDDRTNVNFGCISHNTIQPAGDDILFCSRNGIHSLRRSRDNGIVMQSVTLSEPVKNLFRSLVRGVTDTQTINAVYDRDEGQYHVFFPQPDSVYAKRLTVTIPTGAEQNTRFSTGDFLQARCGAFLGGKLVYGSPAGLFSIVPASVAATNEPIATAITPILWLGDISNNKHTHSLVVQASGSGAIEIEATRDDGSLIEVIKMEIDGALDDNDYLSVPVSKQYERIFEHKIRGVRFKFTITGAGLVRLSGFAIRTRKE